VGLHRFKLWQVVIEYSYAIVCVCACVCVCAGIDTE